MKRKRANADPRPCPVSPAHSVLTGKGAGRVGALTQPTRKSGGVAPRTVLIPILASFLAVGYVVLRSPAEERASAMTFASDRVSVSRDAVAQRVNTPASEADPANAAHEALDPVGVGLRTSR